jgi:hypothetical protein
MPKPSLADLTAFASIAEHRSFRRAADALGVSRSSLSHVMRALEGNRRPLRHHRLNGVLKPSSA